MRLPQPKPGEPLLVSKSELEFNFFPMRRSTSRWGLNAMIYASDPWATIHDALGSAQLADYESADSFLRQAKEFFRAADASGTPESRPLLYYYSFMNLTKALALVRGRPNIVGKAIHGVSDDQTAGHAVTTAKLNVQTPGSSSVSVLNELHVAVTGQPVFPAQVKVSELLLHSVIAHRLWAYAGDRKERFISVERVRIMHDPSTRTIWSTITVRPEVLAHRGWTVSKVRTLSGLSSDFRPVDDPAGNRIFEQISPITYTGRPSDVVMDVVGVARPHLWQTVTSAPPYRRYYLLLTQPNEQRLHQIVSAYLILFWLGSLTRYRPTELLAALSGPWGGFFREFLATQPQQLLYLLASEFRQQEVSRSRRLRPG